MEKSFLIQSKKIKKVLEDLLDNCWHFFHVTDNRDYGDNPMIIIIAKELNYI